MTTALTEEQKLNEAGVGRCVFRDRLRRFLSAFMLSFSKLVRRRLKLTDQAQWIMSVISVVMVV